MTNEAFTEALTSSDCVLGDPHHVDVADLVGMWLPPRGGTILLLGHHDDPMYVTVTAVFGDEPNQVSKIWVVSGIGSVMHPATACAVALEWIDDQIAAAAPLPVPPPTSKPPSKPKRTAVPKATRFEVFKRDKFTCQYCGAKAPDVVLECDHITPHSLTQDNSILNLVTACHACNNGKSNKVLSDDSAVTKKHAQLSQLQERRDQLDMMMQWQRSLVSLETDTVTAIVDFFAELTPGWAIGNESNITAIKKSLKKYTATDVMEIIRDVTSRHVVMDGKKATKESADAASAAFFSELKYRKRREEDPEGSALYYIRAIVRNRSGNWTEYRSRVCLEILRDALVAGVCVEEMKSIAKRMSGWTPWVNEMNERTDAEKRGA